MNVTVEERPRYFPGCCVITGAADRPVITTEYEVMHLGRFQIRESVFVEIAEKVGMVSAQEVGELREQHARLSAENERLAAELEAANAELDTLEGAVELTLKHGAVTKRGKHSLRERAPKVSQAEVAA